jgi:hypothetical protein
VRMNLPVGLGSYGPVIAFLAGTKPPGFRIHMDDDFYVHDRDPLALNTLVPDYGQFGINPTVDANLLQGTITIGPANSQGRLWWNFPNSLRIWWQPVPGGPWSQVKSGGKPDTINFKASGQQIPIAIQGIVPDSDKFSVAYMVDGQQQSASATFFFNVYTGLKVGGDGAPQQKLVQQLEEASSYGLTVDTRGNVWRNSVQATYNPNQAYMGWFVQYLAAILRNPQYSAYLRETATTAVIAVATPNFTPWIPDSYQLKSFYPDNIEAISGRLGGDGPKYEAAMIIHALEEQYQTQILDPKLPLETNPNGKPDINKGGAFAAGVKAEQTVLSWGDREGQPEVGAGLINLVEIDYTDVKTKTEVNIGIDPQTKKFISAFLVRLARK